MKRFMYDDVNTVVQTDKGKIQGFFADHVYKFYGIKYADAKRFHSPVEVEPWEGVKKAITYGYVCPLLHEEKPDDGEIRIPHRYWPKNENCQYLNIWTKSVEPVKKPVMVWIHGGGFTEGSSIEQAAYDGTNLCSFGDVVVVTLNHRLNILGYLDLSAYGEEYKNSANAGAEDLVAALRWIKANIEGFGGDPDNVTLFGQSCGGEKVWMLMQTPEADGLFHKVIIQSGVLEGVIKGDTTQKITSGAYNEAMESVPFVERLMKELGVSKVKELEDIPYAKLAEAYNRISPEMAAKGQYVGAGPMPNYFYLGNPRYIGFTEHAKTIPVLIGTVANEIEGFGPKDEKRYTMTAEEELEKVQAKYGERYAARLIELYKKVYPGKSVCDLLRLDSLFRCPTIEFIRKRTEEEMAPTYSYYMNYEFTLDGGAGPWHCAEIPFVFHNTALVPSTNISEETDVLEERLCRTWTRFAYKGDPNHEEIPSWQPCAKGDEACMMIDNIFELKHNHDHELIALKVEAAAQQESRKAED